MTRSEDDEQQRGCGNDFEISTKSQCLAKQKLQIDRRPCQNVLQSDINSTDTKSYQLTS